MSAPLCRLLAGAGPVGAGGGADVRPVSVPGHRDVLHSTVGSDDDDRVRRGIASSLNHLDDTVRASASDEVIRKKGRRWK